MKATTRLRQLIADPEILVAPGAYDGITARLIEQAGFSALYMTGAGTSASFGLPDYGLLTMTEMVGNAARITAAASSLPLIADYTFGAGAGGYVGCAYLGGRGTGGRCQLCPSRLLSRCGDSCL